jgi:long-chain acyl-CoA synthetase
MNEHFWTAFYPDFVPKQLPLSPFKHLSEYIENSCRVFSDNIALTHFGHDMTYGVFYQQSMDLAAFLQHEFGVKKGDRVAIMLPNCSQYAIAIYATLRIGAVIVNVNPMYTADELVHQLNDSGCQCMVASELFAKNLLKALPKTSVHQIIYSSIVDFKPSFQRRLINFALRLSGRAKKINVKSTYSFLQALSEGRNNTVLPVILQRSDLALLQYTGGTTGVARGVQLTHGNILANVEQLDAWLGHHLVKGAEVNVLALPLYHIFSFTVNFMAMMQMGARHIIITDPRNLKTFIKTLRGYPFTIFSGVNTLFSKLLRNQSFRALDFTSMKMTIGGGMAVQSEVASQWQELTKQAITQGYGLTETSPVVTVNPLTSPFTLSIGLPLPGTMVKIINEQGESVPLGEPGELVVKGPQVTRGYWHADNTACFDSEGYFFTGDVVSMDAKGYLTVKDRKNQMIIVSGFNVYPVEVENVIMKHPRVSEVAVLGEYDPASGERVVAFIVPKGEPFPPRDIVRWCRRYLTAYKVPKLIEFRKDLPKSPVGKVLKKEIKRTIIVK